MNPLPFSMAERLTAPWRCPRSGKLGPLHDPDLGHVRIRWIARRKNLNARLRARRRLRELFSRPLEEKEQYSLADYGVDLEIAAAEEEAGAEVEGLPRFSAG